jgi:hypothetical protein
MGRSVDRQGQGTRFRVFPQAPALTAYREPLVIELSPPRGSVEAGPRDPRMCVIEPIGKPTSYGEMLLQGLRGPTALPPWRGSILEPALPDASGHFDHIPVDHPTFALAHAYAAVRLALDVWEGYLGHPIPWHFTGAQSWLEIALIPTYDNAESGWGWLELGADLGDGRSQQPYATNLDIVAHEVGHLIVHSVIGMPRCHVPGELSGFHEAAADFVALLVSAQLDPVVDEVLRATRGNLYVANELNRLGELSSSTQIRLSSNDVKMSEFALGWSNEHDLSEPLTGALFDLMMDVYQARLSERGLIPKALRDFVDAVGHLRSFAPLVQASYDEHYPRDPQGFREALLDARDLVGTYFARALSLLGPDSLTYPMVERALMRADRELGGGRFAVEIRSNFAWREIGRVLPGPYLGGQRGTKALSLQVHRCAKRGDLRI